jgi:PAS domain S-box-containing protein
MEGPAGIDLAIGGIALVGVWAPLRFHRSGNIYALTLEDAVIAAFILSPRPDLGPIILVLATLLARVAMRPGLAKVVYSIAPVGLGSSAAVLAGTWVGAGPSPLAPRSVGAVVVGLSAYAVVSFFVTAGLFRRLEGTSWADLARDAWIPVGITLVGNSVLGLIIALMSIADARGLVLAALLAVGIQLGYRAYGRMLADRRRAEQLSQLSRELAGVATGRTPWDDWLRRVGDFFGATGVHLRLRGTGADFGDEPPGGLAAEAMASPDAAERSGALVARLGDDQLRGYLAVWGRRGVEAWNDADRHLLEVVAGEVAVALENAELFQQVERERARWQEESSKLNDILSAASDGIAMISSDGTIVSWNPGMTTLTGVEERQAAGKAWWTVLRLRDVDDEDLLPEGSHVVSSALGGERRPDPIALQVLRRDGQWRWLRATFSPLLGDDGVVAGSVIVARDVTAEREAEGLKADFVATVSHELRTPLTPIKGFLTTLQQRGPELTREQIETMYSSMGTQVARLERLVSDLLVVADLDRGRLVLASELVRLRPVVDIAVDDEAGRDRDRITVSGESDLTAAADAAAVVRILRALISNALKHTEGPVEVELAHENRVPVIRVRDHGPGIPAWEQDRVFRRFHRLGDHLLRTQGSGLGLSIARALADRLGGSIDIESELGDGATFTLRLRPAGPVPVPSTERAAEAG